MSKDSPERHREFIEAYKLPFALVSDENGEMVKAFGANYFGGLIPTIRRMTFVLDEKGVVRGVFKHLLPGKHVTDSLAVLAEIKRGT